MIERDQVLVIHPTAYATIYSGAQSGCGWKIYYRVAGNECETHVALSKMCDDEQAAWRHAKDHVYERLSR
jgi:hypothetical protein